MVVHATELDLTDYLAGSDYTPPVGAAAQRKLRNASRLVDSKVVGWYDADDLGVPVEVEIRNALRDATCAQVEQWLSVGEDNDVDGYPQSTPVSTNGTSVGLRPARLSPRARDLLRDAGLLAGRAR